MLGRFETKLTEYQTILYFDDALQSNKLISVLKNPLYPDLGFFKPTIDSIEGLRHLQTPDGLFVLSELPTERPQTTYVGQSYSYVKT